MLEPSRLQLRDVIESDLPVFYLHQSDEESARMADFASRDEAAFMLHWKKIMTQETSILKTILVDGQVVGNIVCWKQDGMREIGYWIGREYWGRGIASAALRSFLTAVPFRPLRAYVVNHNLASRRVLEKCGFLACGADDHGTFFLFEETNL